MEEFEKIISIDPFWHFMLEENEAVGKMLRINEY